MFIKHEQPILMDQRARDNRLLRDGQHLRANNHNPHDDNGFVDPPAAAALRFQFQLQQLQQHRRGFKERYRRCPQPNQQLTHQDINAWAAGLSYSHHIPNCHRPPQQQQFSQATNPGQVQLHHQRFIKMEDSKHFPYIVGTDNDYWTVGDSYGGDSLLDMPAYSTPADGFHQTMGGYNVSARDLGPSHLQSTHHQQPNKGVLGSSSLHHTGWPTFQATYADKYSPPPFASIDSEGLKQQSLPAIFGDPSSTHYVGMHHGLPSADWASESAMPLLGESMSCRGLASPPDTTYSSFSSLSASDAMASMSLDAPMSHHSMGSGDMDMSASSTVSPKVLRINPSPAHTSSPESTYNTYFPTADGESSGASSFEHHRLPLVSSSKRLNAKGRKELPDNPRPTGHQSVQSEVSSSSQRSSNKHTVAHRPKHLPDIKPKPRRISPTEPSSPRRQTRTAQAAERSRQDEFLIRSRRAGMTYRDIRREGNFKEAESTLRGRYRTLTKPKEERRRRPEWTGKDITLLKEAVSKLTKGASSPTAKIPWKKVAEYINKHGSYNFGVGTCSKRWEELSAREENQLTPK